MAGNLRNPETANWRDSARRPVFFVIDAYATFPLLLFLLHITWWTFFLSIGAAIFFGALERFGFTVPVFKRWLRLFFAGNHKMVRPWWTQKR